MPARIWLLIALLLTAGCGTAQSRPATAKVTGVVTMQGQPIADAVVTFYPQVAGGARPATGRTDTTGAFTLTTFDVPGDGAVLGAHKVTILAATIETESNDPAALQAVDKARVKLPEKLSRLDTTTLQVEVVADATKNSFTWELDKL